MRKRIVEMIVLASFLACFYSTDINAQSEVKKVEQAYIIDTQIVDTHTYLQHTTVEIEQEEIRNEIMYGEIEMLAQLVESEAGNQDETGKRYVADVVLNRVESKDFPDTIEEVIYQKNQFSVINNGAFDKAAYNISEESYNVAYEEYMGPRMNTEIIYFRTNRYSSYGTSAFKYGAHYFSK